MFANFFTIALAATSAFALPMQRRVAAEVDTSDITSEVTSKVSAALSDLQTVTGSLKDEIAGLTEVTEATVSPIIEGVLTKLNDVTTLVGGLTPAVDGVAKTAVSDVSGILSLVTTDITSALEPVIDEVTSIPAVKELLGEVSGVLNTLLGTVDGILPGVLPTVVGLLAPVTGLLNTLGLGSLLGLVSSIVQI